VRPPRTLSLVTALALLAAIGGTVLLISRSDDRPNILLIVTDDQRFDTLHGMPAVSRWFVDGGVTFSSAYTTTPLCCPSRASVLTGQYMHNHGIDDNVEDADRLQRVQRRTVQAALRKAGYRTGLFGKLFNNWPNEIDPSFFDRWATTPFVTYTEDEWNVNGVVRPVYQNSVSYLGDLFLDFASTGEQQDRRPWFALVGFMAPHLPITLEPRYASIDVPPVQMTAARREVDRSDKPPYVRQNPLRHGSGIDDRRVAALRSLIAVDDQIDRMMRRLEDLGELDETLVILLSDNGYLWGEHGLFQKSAPYQETVHVPMTARWPGHILPGSTDDRLVGLLDVAPTVLAAAEMTLPPRLDGVDLLGDGPGREQLLLEFRKLEGEEVPSWSAIVTHTSIFVEYRAVGGGLIAREYYDLANDPEQLVNLFGDGDPTNDPDARTLSSDLRSMMGCAGVTCPR
jgi:arylsulfatase A-like enzyme